MRSLLRRATRRRMGAVLIGVGVVAMVLAPESPGGWVVLGIAVALELVGMTLERRG